MTKNKKPFAEMPNMDKNRKLIVKKENMVIMKKGIKKLSFGDRHKLMQASAATSDRKKIRKFE